jgi:hypothetical protein
MAISRPWTTAEDRLLQYYLYEGSYIGGRCLIRYNWVMIAELFNKTAQTSWMNWRELTVKDIYEHYIKILKPRLEQEEQKRIASGARKPRPTPIGHERKQWLAIRMEQKDEQENEHKLLKLDPIFSKELPAYLKELDHPPEQKHKRPEFWLHTSLPVLQGQKYLASQKDSEQRRGDLWIDTSLHALRSGKYLVGQYPRAEKQRRNATSQMEPNPGVPSKDSNAGMRRAGGHTQTFHMWSRTDGRYGQLDGPGAEDGHNRIPRVSEEMTRQPPADEKHDQASEKSDRPLYKEENTLTSGESTEISSEGERMLFNLGLSEFVACSNFTQSSNELIEEATEFRESAPSFETTTPVDDNREILQLVNKTVGHVFDYKQALLSYAKIAGGSPTKDEKTEQKGALSQEECRPQTRPPLGYCRTCGSPIKRRELPCCSLGGRAKSK